MNIVIRRVADKGNYEKERLIMHVESGGDIGRYALLESTYVGEGEVSGKVRNTLWLPEISAEAGELVVVYTKKGKLNLERILTSLNLILSIGDLANRFGAERTLVL